MHILGYNIKDIEHIKKVMQDFALKNEIVVEEVINQLNKKGFDISVKKIRGYIDKCGLNCKYLDKKKLVKYLIFKGYASNVLDAYDRLIGRNTSNYIPISKLNNLDTIKLINDCGGLAVLAHPDTLELYDDKLYNEIKLLVDNGLNGIEVINGQMNNLRFDEYHQLANHFDLFETVGSDFHSTSRHNIGICVDDNLCNNFCKILKKVRSDFMALKRGTVQLEKYNSIWKKSYMEEEKLLKEILNDYIIEIHHVGSTSIEGLMAKPVVDILIVIESLDLIPEIENILMNYNYDNRGPQGVPDRMFFAKGSEDARTHYIHFTTPKSNTYYDLTYFKRYLLDNPDYILKYCKLKQELALKYSNERSKYTQGKSDFIKEVISLAKEEYND